MAAQLNYDYGTPKGIPGGKADLNTFEMVNTRSNEEPTGNLKYGMAVFTGSQRGYSVKKAVTGVDKSDFEGVVVAQANTEHDLEGNVNIRNGATLSVMRRGRIWGRISPECKPEYGKTAYVVLDGEYAGCFTEQASAYSAYEPCESGTGGAKQIIEDSGSVEGEQIKLSEVTPTVRDYKPTVGDYVVSKKIHDVTLDIGASFGQHSDIENGIAVIEG